MMATPPRAVYAALSIGFTVLLFAPVRVYASAGLGDVLGGWYQIMLGIAAAASLFGCLVGLQIAIPGVESPRTVAGLSTGGVLFGGALLIVAVVIQFYVLPVLGWALLGAIASRTTDPEVRNGLLFALRFGALASLFVLAVCLFV